MIRLLAAVLLFAGSAYGQTVQLVGGASSPLNAAGGMATLYTPGSISTVSVGLAGGHLVTGASTEFNFLDWRTRLGDSPLFLSTVDASVSVNLRGVTVSRGDLTLFAGLTGTAYNTPFFNGTRAANFGFGAQYSHKFGDLELSSVGVIDHGVKTFLQGAAYHRKTIRLQTSVGLLENKPFVNLNGVDHWQHFTGTLNRQTYLYGGQRFTSNGIGGYVTAGAFNANVSAYQSGHATGVTTGIGVRASILTVSGQEFISQAKTFSGSVGEAVTQHLRLTQYVTLSGGHPSFSAGGSYTSNRFTVSVSQSSQFTPLGFKQNTNVTLTLQIRDVSLNVATVTYPDGSLHWSGYAGTYVQTGIQPTEHTSSRKMGKYVIRGVVHDDKGNGVEGAALVIDGQTVYTDSTGTFFVRVRHNKPAALTVALDEFTGIGEYEIVQTDTSASPDAAVNVVVRRKP